jgi:dienelactone hydrolase
MAGATGRGRLSRRGFLAGAGLATVAAAGLAVDEGVLPGRSFVHGHLGLDGPGGVVPRVAGGRTVTGSFVSRARLGRRCGWTIALPPSYDASTDPPLPVAVVLHGRGGDHASAFSRGYLGLDRFLAQAVRDGAAPFAMASVDGGETYWHRRADGEDSGAMVVDELLPLLANRRLDVSRLALVGWSMGGYGALRHAGRLGRDRVTAATAMSPALWHRFADTTPGAYDDAADFADATVLGRQRDLDGVRVQIDCGESDPFYAADRDYVGGFRVRPAGGFQRGGHAVGYWRRMAPAHVRFVAASFAAVRRS